MVVVPLRFALGCSGAGLERGLPTAINMDNGTAFTARALDHWACTHQVELDYSRRGKRTDNAFIEAFKRLVRREPLTPSPSWHIVKLRHQERLAVRRARQPG